MREGCSATRGPEPARGPLRAEGRHVQCYALRRERSAGGSREEPEFTVYRGGRR